ncbi:MAG: lytic transglycosylase domain-containing protein [Clostridia bacterium]|nr:lytic transglycosylase domain-containing protein [Clostridia bacterium]
MGIILMLYLGMMSVMYPQKYQNCIQRYADYYGVDSSIVAGIINCESGYNPDVISHAGAVGLMQIMPSTGQYLAELLNIPNHDESKLTEISYNIMLGTFYVSILMDKYGDVPTMLAGYNAGPGKVDIWLRDTKYSQDGRTLDTTPYRETNAYIDKVQKNIRIYSKINKKH